MHTDQQNRTHPPATSETRARRSLTVRRRVAALVAALTMALAACGAVPVTSTAVGADQPPAAAGTAQPERNAGPDHLTSRGRSHTESPRGPAHLLRRPGPDHLE